MSVLVGYVVSFVLAGLAVFGIGTNQQTQTITPFGQEIQTESNAIMSPGSTNSRSNKITTSTESSAAPALVVMSPREGLHWVQGRTYTIQWVLLQSLPSENFTVMLKQGAISHTIGNTKNTSFSWTIPSDTQPGRYAIEIQADGLSPVTGETFFIESLGSQQDLLRIEHMKGLRGALSLYHDANDNNAYPPSLTSPDFINSGYISESEYLTDPHSKISYTYVPYGLTSNPTACTSYHLGISFEYPDPKIIQGGANLQAIPSGYQICTAAGVTAKQDFKGSNGESIQKCQSGDEGNYCYDTTPFEPLFMDQERFE